MNNLRQNLFVDGLVQLSCDKDGLVDDGRVRAILQVLNDQYNGSGLRKILAMFLNKLSKKIAQTTLVIEFCGELSTRSIDNLRSHFEQIYGHKLHVVLKENRSLIAGLRVSINGHVREYSINSTLEAYRKSL